MNTSGDFPYYWPHPGQTSLFLGPIGPIFPLSGREVARAIGLKLALDRGYSSGDLLFTEADRYAEYIYMGLPPKDEPA